MAARTTRLRTADGLLLAPIDEGGVWAAIRALRDGMRRINADAEPQAAFLTAISNEGEMVAQGDPRAHVLVLGYRTDER